MREEALDEFDDVVDSLVKLDRDSLKLLAEAMRRIYSQEIQENIFILLVNKWALLQLQSSSFTHVEQPRKHT